jgi:hypothetical protein
LLGAISSPIGTYLHLDYRVLFPESSLFPSAMQKIVNCVGAIREIANKAVIDNVRRELGYCIKQIKLNRG